MLHKLREQAGWPYRRIRNWFIWTIHPWAKASRNRIQHYHRLHENESCVIIGNGPSLKDMELSWLKDQITFGLNRFYLKFPDLGFKTTYLVSVNRLVLEQCFDEMKELEIPIFVNWLARDQMGFSDNIVFLRRREGDSLSFSKKPAHFIWEGATVTYVAMQLAYHMGFKEVYLIGVDHRFETKGQPHQVVVTEESDPNHFDENYFGKGFRWQLPDLQRSEEAFRLARQAYEEDGRIILDATLNGALDIFPKINYKSLVRKAS